MRRLHLLVVLGAFLAEACASDAHKAGGTGDASAGGSPAIGGSSGAGGSDGGAGGRGGADGNPRGAGGGGAGGAGGQTGGVDGGADACSVALPLTCGDRLNHSTVIQGRANMWLGYNRTARAESGRETIYAFHSPSECVVVANLKNLTTDLDLLLLSACDPISGNTMASSTPLDLQTVETVSWTSLPGKISYVVVDGYAGAEGSYTLEVDCTCQ